MSFLQYDVSNNVACSYGEAVTLQQYDWLGRFILIPQCVIFIHKKFSRAPNRMLKWKLEMKKLIILLETQVVFDHVCVVSVSGDSVVLPLPEALNRMHLQPVQEKEKVEVVGVGSASASGQHKAEERSILDELRQVEQRWYSSQAPKQQQQHQLVNITIFCLFNLISKNF